MKRLLNTLYVTTEGAALRKDGENLVAEIGGAERVRVPLHMLGSVVTCGSIFLSPPLIQTCAAAGITQPDEIVRGFVVGKIANQRVVLMRALRDHNDELADDRRAALADAVDRLDRILRRANLATEGVDALRGDEGEAGQCLFRRV